MVDGVAAAVTIAESLVRLRPLHLEGAHVRPAAAQADHRLADHGREPQMSVGGGTTDQPVGRGPAAAEVPVGFSPRLYNEDLAPAKERKWGTWSLFCMWMSDVHSIGGYTFAAGLFFLGLSGWWVLSALVVGIVLVFWLMNLSGFAGQKLGVPYPVLARISFGVFGANLPALLRAAIAIAWYGIQTWLASRAVVIIALQIWPDLHRFATNNFLGESTVGWVAFLFMWGVQLLLLRNGMETIRRFQDWAGPAVWVAMFALTVYILVKADWSISLNLSDKAPRVRRGARVLRGGGPRCRLLLDAAAQLLRLRPVRPGPAGRRGRQLLGPAGQLHRLLGGVGAGDRRDVRGVRGVHHRPGRGRRAHRQRGGPAARCGDLRRCHGRNQCRR